MKNLGSSQLACKKQVDLSGRASVRVHPVSVTIKKIEGGTLSDGSGRYPDRMLHHCLNAGVTDPRTWPSIPHFLASEGLMRSHVREVGKWDPIPGQWYVLRHQFEAL